jgi:hypothetical protein
VAVAEVAPPEEPEQAVAPEQERGAVLPPERGLAEAPLAALVQAAAPEQLPVTVRATARFQ